MTMKPLLKLLLLLITSVWLLSGCEKYWLDKQMEELCAKDGGIQVFETVQLPPEMFDRNGDAFPGWRSRTEAQRYGDGYELRRTETVLKAGDPIHGQGKLSRYEWTISRRTDGKVLGKGIVYGRSGGDFIVVDHFTSKTCPATLGMPSGLEKAVFKKVGG